MEKCYWLFVEETSVMPTTGLAYKNTSSLLHYIDMLHDIPHWTRTLWWTVTRNTIRSVHI